MSRPLVSDELWRLIEPLIPKRKPRLRGGRPPIIDRGAGRDFVRPQEWRSLGNAAAKNVIRERHHVLAAVVRLADRRCLGAVKPNITT